MGNQSEPAPGTLEASVCIPVIAESGAALWSDPYHQKGWLSSDGHNLML